MEDLPLPPPRTHVVLFSLYFIGVVLVTYCHHKPHVKTPHAYIRLLHYSILEARISDYFMHYGIESDYHVKEGKL